MAARDRKWTILGVITIAAVGLQACGDDSDPGADGADVCADYPSRDIRFIVPYDTGGGFDTWSRLLQEHMPGHLPNEVEIVVENRPGAGGVSGATDVYAADPDGYTIGITEPGILATTQIGGQTEIDLEQVTAIGRIAVSPEVIFVADGHEWQTIEDVQAAGENGPVLMATGGLAAVNIVSFDALGIPFDNIVHDGSEESVLSLIRGDTDIAVFTLNSQLQNLRNGELRPLALVGTKPDEGETGFDAVADVPTLDELTGIDGLGSALEQHRIVHAPPGVPDCAVDILSDALVDTLEDPELIAAAEDAGQLPPTPADAAETQEIVSNVLEQLQEYAGLLGEQVEG